MKNEWKKINTTKKGKTYFLLASGVLLFIFLGIALFGEHGIIDTLRIYREVKILEGRIEKIQDENKQLEEEIARLKNDKKYIEKIARENLGMVGKNEIIYFFDANKK